MLKELNLGRLYWFVNGFDTQYGIYTVQWSDGVEEMLTEDLIAELIVDSPDNDNSNQIWIPFKGQSVHVKGRKIQHDAMIDPLYRKNRGKLLFIWPQIKKVHSRP